MSNVEMKKPTVIKYRLFTIGQYEKEEQWLNEMAAKGFMLVRVFGLKYEFEQGLAGSFQYRLEFLNDAGYHSSNTPYFSFLQENDIEIIGFWGRWVYLRKQTKDGPFVLYSDQTSIYQHYRRIYQFALLFTVVEGILFITRVPRTLQTSIDSSTVITVLLGVITLLFGRIAYTMHKRMKHIKKNQNVFDA